MNTLADRLLPLGKVQIPYVPPKAGTYGLLLSETIGIGHGKLKANVLVFETLRALKAYTTRQFHDRWIPHTKAMVKNVSVLLEELDKKTHHPIRTRIYHDEKYVCVILFAKGWLSMEAVCHEATHAGFAFARRMKRVPWQKQAMDFDEEAICYPTGKISRAINKLIWRHNLYER